MAVHVLVCLSDDDARECNQRDEVRDGHEAVDDIGEDPDGFELEEGTGGDQRDEDQAVGQHTFVAEEVDAGALAVVVPAENRREGEEHERDRQQLAAEEAIGTGEGSARHCGTGGVALPDAREYEREARHGADDDCVDEGTRHRDQALLSRPLRLGGSGGNRRGAKAGLVGEDAARDAVLYGHHDRGAGEAAGGCGTREGVADDHGDGGRDLVEVEDDQAEADGDIRQGHERHDTRGDLGDALQAAERDGGDEDGQDDVRREFREAEGNLHAVDDGVDLREGADAEVSDTDAGEREERRERLPLLAHAVADVEHRAAGNLALLVDGAEFDGQEAFRILRGHAEEGSDPHPEDGAGAADLDGRGDADDVARADRGGEGDAEGFEARDVTASVVLCLEDQLERLRQAEDLQELQADGQVDTRADEQCDERRAPHEGVDGIEYRDE